MTLRSLGPLVVALSLVVGGLALGSCGSERLDLVGVVELRILELGSPVSEVIVGIPVEIGDEVTVGEILVQLDSEVAELELSASQAALQAATATLTAMRRELERFQRLRQSNVSSQQQLDAAQRGHDEALSLSSEREARVAQARKRLEDHTIRSFSAGVVDQLPYDVGERVPLGGVLAVILADDEPWVRIWMPARAVTRTPLGAPVEVKIQGVDGWLTGEIVEIAHQPSFTPHYAMTEKESAHLVYESRVRIENAPPNLRPGLTARVRTKAGASKAAASP